MRHHRAARRGELISFISPAQAEQISTQLRLSGNQDAADAVQISAATSLSLKEILLLRWEHFSADLDRLQIPASRSRPAVIDLPLQVISILRRRSSRQAGPFGALTSIRLLAKAEHNIILAFCRTCIQLGLGALSFSSVKYSYS
jgi:integrase